MKLRSTSIAFLSLCAAAGTLRAVEEPQIHILVPRFDGIPNIGGSVATVLNLELWRTMKASPKVNGVLFSGRVSWSPEALPEQSHISAEEVAQKPHVTAQMVLWGKAWEFGNGVVAQTYLSLPNYEDLRPTWPERWFVKLKLNKADAEWELDIPTRRYEFPPIALRSEVVSQFRDVGGLILYRDQELQHPLHKLEMTNFTGSGHAGDRSQLTLPNGETGWIKLPKLSDQTSSIINFVGGVIRIFRGDYAGAQELLQSVSRAEDANQQLRLDSLLYLALAADRLDADPLVYTRAALKLNPYSAAAVRYHLTAQCSVFSRNRMSEGRTDTRAFVNALNKTIGDYGYLLAADDPILRGVRALVSER